MSLRQAVGPGRPPGVPGDAPDLAADGSPMLDDDFLVLLNRWEPLDFTIPTPVPSRHLRADGDGDGDGDGDPAGR